MRGVAYFVATPGQPIRSAWVGLEPSDRTPVAGGDPTGCGDVFGAVACAHLLQGASLDAAIRAGSHMAARNVSHRGATGLRDHLLGRLASV